MYYAGFDLHKETIYGTVIDEKDNVIVEGELPNSKEGIRTFLTDFHPSRIKITMEACSIDIKEVTSRVNNIARNREITNLLQTIPGVGKFTSLLIAAEIGDINRFENPKSLVSYAGLCPGIYQSGSKSHTVRRKEYSHWLKWAVVESSGRAAITQNKYARHYHRIKKRRDSKIARRSVARRMLTDIYYILKNEQPYHSPLI